MTVREMDNGNALGSGTGSKMFEFEVKSSEESGKIRLVSIAPDRHMNVVIMKDNVLHTSITLSVDNAIAVRDALLRAYPLPKLEPSEYRVVDMGDLSRGGRWAVVQERIVPQTVRVATSKLQDDAKNIAKALNEAEGL